MSLNRKLTYRQWLHSLHDPDGPPPDPGRRWWVFRLVVVVSLLVLAVRLAQLQLVQGDAYSRAAESNSLRRLPIAAPRGVFYDRNGELLTTNRALWRVSLTLANMPEDEQAYQAELNRLEDYLKLGGVVVLDAAQLPADPVSAARVAAAARVTAQQVDNAVRTSRKDESSVLLRGDVPREELATLRERLKDIPGVTAELRLQWLVEHSGMSAFRPAPVADNVDRSTALAIESARLLIPGVSIEQVPSRSYVDGPIFSNVIGYVGKLAAEQVDALQKQAKSAGQRPYALDDTVGKTGLESVLEGYLRGTPGAREVEVTSTNRVVREGPAIDPIPGDSVTLTLDASLQRTAYSALMRGIEQSGARSGALVALDPRSGEVLALVSAPGYDNNLFIGGMSYAEYGKLQNDPAVPLLDKAIGGQYSPGALVKPFVAAAALAERVIDPTIRYVCGGKIDVAQTAGSPTRETFPDANPTPLGPVNVTEALARSCDVFFYILAGPEQRDSLGRPLRFFQPGDAQPTEFHGLGIDRINRFLANFGLGRPMGLGLPGEASGLLADPAWKRDRFPGSPWSLPDTLRAAVGRGYTTVTPIQMASALTAIANGGTVYKPTLVRAVDEPTGKRVLSFQPAAAGNAGLTPDHLATVRAGMAQAVTSGTAAYLAREGRLPQAVQTAAVTGTPPSYQRRLGLPVHAWFGAFAPADRPTIALAVVLDSPTSDTDYSALVGSEVLRYYFGKER